MIGVVHLVWAPLGAGSLRDFLRSYHLHPSGARHELVILLNGAGLAEARGARDAVLAELGGTEHRLIELERPALDLAAYAEAARRLEYRQQCFLNSYSVIQVDGWLAQLVCALERPGVGIAGATGSWESQSEWKRGRAVHWPLQVMRLPGARRDFPRFPNPHIRTTGFLVDRSTLLQMGLENARDKRAAYRLESGHAGVTRKLQERGLKALVVGRDGVGYETAHWANSGTYRSGGQENLLVADNRTRDWQRAGRRLKHRLCRDAWGSGCQS
ncbi:MAG: hypothetical protein ACRDJX_07305 [Solirubrobacteraceae bacterium]